MNLKNIAATCASVLGLRDVTELIDNQNTSREQFHANSNFGILHRCANLVLGNIAGNYVECKTSQELTVYTNRINFDRFENDLVKITSVKKEGQDVYYELYTDHIKLENGTVLIEYCYMPRFDNAESEIVISGISADCLVYGILAEYAFINGMFNEAKVWNEKFEQFLFGTARKDVVLPSSRF